MAVYNSWKDLFEIEKRDEQGVEKAGKVTSSSWFRHFWNNVESKVEERFFVIDRLTNEVVGKYDSYFYAKNRAKYKFKRRMRSIDKMLLG